jgi:hypothetical protein
VGFGVVGQTQLVEDAQLIMVLEDSGLLAGRTSQSLLLLHVVGKITQCLAQSISDLCEERQVLRALIRPFAARPRSVWGRSVRSSPQSVGLSLSSLPGCVC